MSTSFNVNVHDLQYILRQIKIGEASSAAYNATPKTILQAIMDEYGVSAANAAQLPAGLRTVDGTENNLLAGKSEIGAADTLFPRLTDPNFITVNGPGVDFNGDGIADVVNHNYDDTNGNNPGGIRSVSDVDPRVISNLIVDMSVSNPAAIAAFLANPLSLAAFADLTGLPEEDAEAWLTDPLNEAAANALMKTIPTQSPDIGLSPGFNSWMTFFGQFFDHGLDLVTKGNNGTVYIPLLADDPLYDKGADGIANNFVNVYFVSEPISGDPLPATSTTPSAWQAFYATDPSDRGSFPPGSFAPALTATDTGFAVQFNDDGAGADGIFNTLDDSPNFMALTRATVTFDEDGVPQHENTTTSWIDQNQTYTSHASHQVFLREYVLRDIDGPGGNGPVAVSTGHLLDGKNATGSVDGAVANWFEVKKQATEKLGLTMNDFNVHDAPLLRTDQYGKFIAGANGFAQVAVNVTIVNSSTGALISTVGTTFVEGVDGGLDINALTDAHLPAGFVLPALGVGQSYSVTTIGTGHAFLNDIAHHAAPGKYDSDGNGTKDANQVADSDMLDANGDGVSDAADVAVLSTANNFFGVALTDANGDLAIDVLDLADVNLDGVINAKDAIADDHNATTYDDEMLNAHFITGDGRGNENIALTAVHSVFHSEHNRAVEASKATLLANATTDEGLAFLNEWLAVDVTEVPSDTSTLVWDGERLFQAARFTTEMQYQHLVFEEFARRIQPNVDPFVFNNSPNIDASIVAEFAHTVYRFGHSMLTGTVDRLDNGLDLLNGDADQQTLLATFLNPQMYLAGGATVEEINANLVRGLSRDVGNQIDEFIVSDLRSSLVGLPLDLAALNIARGRDTGIPSLNETRKQLYEAAATPVADLKPYESWADFGAHIKNPASLVNFIAAYGTHATILAATTTAGMRDAAAALIQGALNVSLFGSTDPADEDAYEFLHGLGTYGDLGGLNDVDLWIGGLAEANPEFGGMLGTTFNYVFEYQMEQLQAGDRLYYLTRTQGTNLLNNLEPNTFSDLVMRNTDLGDIYATHLSGALFITPDHIIELDRGIAQEDYNGTASGLDPVWAPGESHSPLTPFKVLRSYAGATTVVDSETGITHDVGGLLRYTGGEHVVIGGTEGNDKIWSDIGDDTLWGDGGNDYLNGGTGADDVFGGEGDDIIEDPFGDDVLRGNQGNDVISASRGVDLVFGDEGRDYLMLGQDASEVFGGEGDDFILGGAGGDFLLGNEGSDWIEGGAGFDTLAGDNSELFFNSTIIGHDVLFGQGDETDYDAESGDDIMGGGASVFRYEGMYGFDWALAKGDYSPGGVNYDMAIKIFTNDPDEVLRDRFDLVEALSGWNFNDTLTGDSAGQVIGVATPGATPTTEFINNVLDQAGIDRIDGFSDWFGGARETLFGDGETTYRDGNILLGGGGNDTLMGRGGYDLIDGDSHLNVRIKIVIPTAITVGSVTYAAGTVFSAESMSTDTSVMGQYAGKVFNTNPDGTANFASPAFAGATLNSLMLKGTINPGWMSIVREIVIDNQGIDTAVFQGTMAEYDIEGLTTSGINYTGTILSKAHDVDGDGFISIIDRDNGVVGATIETADGNGLTLASRRLLTDNHDLLKNVEQFQFADRTFINGAATDITWTGVRPASATTTTAPGSGVVIASLSTVDVDNTPVTWSKVSGDANIVVSAGGDVSRTGGFAASSVYDLEVRATETIVPGLFVTESFKIHTGSTGNDSINGSTLTDIMYGLAGNDGLNGLDGDDTLYGQAHDDTLNGGNGNDDLTGGSQNDTVNGGAGNDTIRYTAGDGVDNVDGGADFDRMVLTGTAVNFQYDFAFNGTSITQVEGGAVTGVERFELDMLAAGTDNVSFATSTAGVTFDLTSGTGSGGFASILNVDNVTGTNFADTLIGLAGATNILTGGGGDDTFVVHDATDTVSELNLLAGGVDTVQSGITYTITDGDVENLTLTGTGNINGTGNASANVLTGNSGNNILTGLAGTDSLIGDDGADTLIGGAGADNLTGGAGADIYDFDLVTESIGANRDSILDFAVGDIIDLSTIDANTSRSLGAVGNNTFQFIGTAAFSDTEAGAATLAQGQIRYVQIGSDTFIQGNTNGDLATVEFEVRVTGLHTFAASDFVL